MYSMTRSNHLGFTLIFPSQIIICICNIFDTAYFSKCDPPKKQGLLPCAEKYFPIMLRYFSHRWTGRKMDRVISKYGGYI